MRILAIDTSVGAASVAVTESGRAEPFAALSRPMTRGHADALAPMVEEAMRGVDGGFPSLTRIAVATGPGSFTGIRIGLAMARAMGVALGVPVVGVSTLAAFAAPLLSEPRTGIIAAAIDARHGSIYFQLFEPSGRPRGQPRCDTPRECVRAIGAGPAWLAGDAAALVAGEAQRAGLPYDLDAASAAPDIVALAWMGLAVDPANSPARPLYVKPPDARPNAAGIHRSRAGLSAPRPKPMIFGLSRSPPPVIRLLRPDRAQACARLHGQGFAHPWSAQEIAALIASSSTVGAAALDPVNGRLRGFVLSRFAADEAEILTIAVDVSFQGKGVGRALLKREPAPGGECGGEGDVPRGRQGQRPGARPVRALRIRQSRGAGRLLSPQGRNPDGGRRHAQGAGLRGSHGRLRFRMLSNGLFPRDRKAPTLSTDPSGAPNCPNRLCLKAPMGSQTARGPHGRSSSHSDAR